VPETALISQTTVDKPKWSIAYNSKIERKLDITFEHALKHIPQALALRFSPDGKFLAVALGRELGTRIYDVKTMSMKW
jgi:WD40 repeat protein